MDFLSYLALGMIIAVLLILAYGMIAIHDIPYHMAQKRNHPHQDAIHAGGWISLFTLHAIWPFLWIWATAYHPEGGYAGKVPSKGKEAQKLGDSPESNNDDLAAKVRALEEKITHLEKQQASSSADSTNSTCR